MKYTLLLTTIIAFSANAQNLYGDKYPYSPTYQHKQRMGYYHEPLKPGITHSLPNIFGGEDFYGNKGYVGRTMPNIFGGRDFHRNY